jgi:DNA-binding CsgD family transcriptional regulator
MFQIDNLTVIYLIGLVSLSYGIVQALTLRDEFHSSQIWALSQALFGLGIVGLVYFAGDPLSRYWIASYAILVLAGLTQLVAIARFGQNTIPRMPALICIAVLCLVAVLFEYIRQFGAPLASLQTLLFAPVVAIYIYSAWFSGKLGKIAESLYLKLISGTFWVFGLILALALLISLAGFGKEMVNIDSVEIRILALATLIASLVSNYLWSIQASELSQTSIQLLNFGIALEAKANAVPVFLAAPKGRGLTKLAKLTKLGQDSQNTPGNLNSSKAVKPQSPEENHNPSLGEVTSSKESAPGDSTKTTKATAIKSLEKSPEKRLEVDPNTLSTSEKQALVDRLTEREKEVFLLAADGLKNGQIATALNSGESSVKVHRSRMVSKLTISSVEGLAKLKAGLVLSTSADTSVATQSTQEPVRGLTVEQTAEKANEQANDQVADSNQSATLVNTVQARLSNLSPDNSLFKGSEDQTKT